MAMGLAGAAVAAEQAAPSGVRKFTMTAKNYEFDPSVITVKKGEKVRLGDPTTIEFTADKAGTFEFKCSVYCGLGHRKMKGKLVVEE